MTNNLMQSKPQAKELYNFLDDIMPKRPLCMNTSVKNDPILSGNVYLGTTIMYINVPYKSSVLYSRD